MQFYIWLESDGDLMVCNRIMYLPVHLNSVGILDWWIPPNAHRMIINQLNMDILWWSR
jgi:hypothetical protein